MNKSADDNKYPARKDGGGGSICWFDFILLIILCPVKMK